MCVRSLQVNCPAKQSLSACVFLVIQSTSSVAENAMVALCPVLFPQPLPVQALEISAQHLDVLSRLGVKEGGSGFLFSSCLLQGSPPPALYVVAFTDLLLVTGFKLLSPPAPI